MYLNKQDPTVDNSISAQPIPTQRISHHTVSIQPDDDIKEVQGQLNKVVVGCNLRVLPKHV